METLEEKVRKRRKRRNKYRMKQDLLEAVRVVLKEKGYVNLNIQNICEYADVDRNAIYRHFNDFENLLSKFIESKKYWKDSFRLEIDEKIDDYREYLKKILFDQYNSINRNPELQHMLAWELVELSLRTKLIAKCREDQFEEFITLYEKQFEKSGIDINSSIAIIIAGVYYLIMHRKHSTFCKVDFVKEKERMLGVVDQMVDILFDAKEKREQTMEFASNALKNGIDKQTVSKIFGLEPEAVETIKI